MASTSLRSIGVATESTFAAVATNGIPSTSGLTFYGLECDRAEVQPFGDPETVEREETRAGFYALPPEPIALHNGTSYVRRRRGDITLTMALRSIGDGTNYATYAAIPWYMLLRTVLGHSVPGTVADALSAEASINEHTASSGGTFLAGRGFKTDIASGTYTGRPWYQFTTDVTGSTIKASPGLMLRGAGSSQRQLQTAFYAHGATGGSSVCLYLAGDGWKTYAFGCRASRIRLFVQSGMLKLEVTLRAAYITDDHGSGLHATNPVRASGVPAQFKRSLLVVGNTAIGSTSPAALEASPVACDMDSFEAAVDVTLAEVGTTADAVGFSDFERTDYDARLSVTASYADSTYAGDMFTQTERSVLAGFGPIGNGMGACVYMPAAHLVNDPSRFDVSGGIVKTRLEYRAGLWTLDTNSTAPQDTPFRLGFGL